MQNVIFLILNVSWIDSNWRRVFLKIQNTSFFFNLRLQLLYVCYQYNMMIVTYSETKETSQGVISVLLHCSVQVTGFENYLKMLSFSKFYTHTLQCHIGVLFSIILGECSEWRILKYNEKTKALHSFLTQDTSPRHQQRSQ